jgi:hypothetical protein
MINIVTPDSSPEEIEAFTTQMKELASLFNRDEALKGLLADAQAGKINEEELLAAVMLANQAVV